MSGRTFRPHTLSCLLLFFAAFPVHAQSTTTLQGTVVDSQTHRGIARALVELNGNQPGQMTDNDGHFFLLQHSWRHGSNSLSQTGLLRSVDRSSERVEVSYAGCCGRGTGFRSDTHAGAGRCRALARSPCRTATPSAGVRVDLYAARVEAGWRRWRIERSTSVRARGAFFFGNLEPGSYAVHVEGSVDPVPYGTAPGVRSGYAPVFAPSAPDLSSATVAVLRPGQTAEIDAELSRVTYYPGHDPCRGGVLGLRRADHRQWLHALVGGLLPRRAGPDDGVAQRQLCSARSRLRPRFGNSGHSASGELPFQVHDAPATNLSMTLTDSAPMALSTQVDAGSEAASAQSSTVTATPRLILLLFTPTDASDQEPLMGFVHQDSNTGVQTLQSNLVAGTYRVSGATSGGYLASLSSGGTDLFTPAAYCRSRVSASYFRKCSAPIRRALQ